MPDQLILAQKIDQLKKRATAISEQLPADTRVSSLIYLQDRLQAVQGDDNLIAITLEVWCDFYEKYSQVVTA